jgi:hypothetical protein
VTGEKEEVRPECDLEINLKWMTVGGEERKTLRDAGHHRGVKGKRRELC